MIKNGKDMPVCVAKPWCVVTVSVNISLGSTVIAADVLAHVRKQWFPRKQRLGPWESAARWNLISKKCRFQGVKTGVLFTLPPTPPVHLHQLSKVVVGGGGILVLTLMWREEHWVASRSCIQPWCIQEMKLQDKNRVYRIEESTWEHGNESEITQFETAS